MRYVAAYLLAVLGGNNTPSVSDIKAILDSAGIGYDEERAETVVNKLAGKDLSELMAEGRNKMASMPSGSAAPAASGASATGQAEAKEEEKEEKKEESEESDDDMGLGLFD